MSEEAQELLTLMSECNEGREIVSGSDGSVFIPRATAIQFALELAARKVADAIAAERERCAALMETFPDQMLRIWDRPGGPPGNGYVLTTNADRAAAIRASSAILPR